MRYSEDTCGYRDHICVQDYWGNVLSFCYRCGVDMELLDWDHEAIWEVVMQANGV